MTTSHTTRARCALAAGIAAFIVLGVMMFAGGGPRPATYPNRYGFTAAMYWFEVANSPADLFQVLGDPASLEGSAIRSALDTANRIDFAFMAAYPLFFALLFLLLRGLIGEGGTAGKPVRSLVLAGVTLSIVMLAGDILENVQLLKLTGYGSPEEVDGGVIALLMAFTRVKWFAIFMASVLIGLLYRKYFGRGIPGMIFVVLYLSSGIIGFLSFFIPAWRGMLEMSSNILGAAWIASIVHTGIVAFPRKDKRG